MRECNQPVEITIPDIADAEVSAMTQAMYSRSNKRIKMRLEELNEEGEQKAKESLNSFYLGYGHNSINDCGFTTIYIEGVSNVVAKAFEDTPLFNGQESSTRYLDYSTQSIVDPYDWDKSHEIINGWLELYLTHQPSVVNGLKKRYPIGENENPDQYERAIKARSFDIMRGFLPVGVTTQFSWTVSLRHARDRIRFLIAHPCKEVRDVAKGVHALLLEKYPNSFKASDVEENEITDYYKHVYFHYYQVNYENMEEHDILENFKKDKVVINVQPTGGFNLTEGLIDVIINRPKHAQIPATVRNLLNIRVVALLDFGSYRDLQRHRRMWCPIPLVKDYGYGIHKWYLDEVKASLEPEEHDVFIATLDEIWYNIQSLKFLSDRPTNDYDNQYLYPMGVNIVTEFHCDLGQAVYLSELRSQPTVHETLRPIAQALGNAINDIFEDKLINVDDSPSAFNIARGKQTIFKDGKEIT